MIEGEWVCTKKSSACCRAFVDTFINRHNNGVLSELTVPVGEAKKIDWTKHTLKHNASMLRAQDVNRKGPTLMANVSGDAWIAAARYRVPPHHGSVISKRGGPSGTSRVVSGNGLPAGLPVREIARLLRANQEIAVASENVLTATRARLPCRHGWSVIADCDARAVLS